MRLYSPKQEEVLRFGYTDDWRMLVNHGTIRSGKTTVDNEIFLAELVKARAKAKADGNAPLYGMSGTDLATLRNNVLDPLEEKYGISTKFDDRNSFPLLGCRVICWGHSKADSFKKLVGATLYGFYHNEMTTAHQSFIDEAQKRCIKRLRIIGDTNPDHPEHYIKKDYIDRADGKRIAEFSWRLDDNIFLTEAEKEDIKALTPSGMFYERKINGLWVTADGIVYQDFDNNKHFISDAESRKYTRFFAAVDWGYEHWGVIQLWGETDKGEYILVREIAAQHQEIDYWVDVALELKRQIGKTIPFFCDSARPEHIQRFVREGIWAFNADKSILSGIEEVAKRLKQNKLFISDKATLFKNQIYSYSWDKKSGLPIKKDDDSMDTMRYAIYTAITRPNIR